MTGKRVFSGTKRRFKYNNRKVGEFDSVKESERHTELKWMEKAGIIINLEHHVSYELIPVQYEYIKQYSKRDPSKEIKPKRITIEQSCNYEADFVYVMADTLETVVEDSKGVRTEVFKIKKKLMLERHGIKIKET